MREVAIEVEMVGLDIGHDGQVGAIAGEGAIGLIGLGDKDRPRAAARISFEAHEF